MKKFVLVHETARSNAVRYIYDLAIRDRENKPFQVAITELKDIRTLEQNKKLHAMFGEIANASGWTPGGVKYNLVKELAGVDTFMAFGRVVEVPKKTSEMDVEELSALIEKLYAWGYENDFHFTQ